VKPALLALAIVLVFRTVAAEPFMIPTASMAPTLLVGDEIVVSKYPYGYSRFSWSLGRIPGFAGRAWAHAPERGDVIVFRLPRDHSINYVKRLIGLPGDHIRMRRGQLYINGTLAPRRFAGTAIMNLHDRPVAFLKFVETLPNGREHKIFKLSDDQPLDNTSEFIVPPDHYFMMGDNRDDSQDSRVAADHGGVGFVPDENLVGRVDLVLFSRDPAIGWLDVERWLGAFRGERFFDAVE